MSDYERGALRFHGSTRMVRFAEALGVSVDELLGLEERPSPPPGIKNRHLLRRVQEIERLPRRDQQALLRTIDAFLGRNEAVRATR